MRSCLFVFLIAVQMLAESAAGLRWTAPAGWKSEGSRPMRAATYIVDGAECGVYFFGAGMGGTVQANLDRWKAQVLAPNGKPAEARIGKRTIHGLAVTTIDTSGDYTGMGGPMAAAKTVQPGYRLLGAIVEGPGGNLFIKFAGPAKTIAQNQQKFEQMLASFDKGEK